MEFRSLIKTFVSIWYVPSILIEFLVLCIKYKWNRNKNKQLFQLDSRLYILGLYFVNENVWVIFFLCKGSPCDKNWNKFNLMAYNNFFSNKKGQQKYYRGTCLWWKGHRWKEYTRTFKKRREKYRITCWRCWPKKVNLLDFFPIFELCEAKNTAD